MRVVLLEEHGYESALKGLALSYYREGYDFGAWWTVERRIKAEKQLAALAFKGGGHNKALASVFVWAMVTAPRAWYSEYDTYKVATTANSSSSMHTLSKEPVTAANFEEGTSKLLIDNLNQLILDKADITTLKMNLPEGYLQTRQICVNYLSLQNIIRQRRGHRLKMWDVFIDSILEQVEHPELLVQ